VPVRVRSLSPVLPDGWEARLVATCAAAGRDCPDAGPGDTVAPGALLVQRYEVSVPADAPATEPYYLRKPRHGDMYRWTGDAAIDGLPFQPADVRARAKLIVAGARVTLERDAQHRIVDRVLGEIRRPVMVVPAVSVALEPGPALLPPSTAGPVGPSAAGGSAHRLTSRGRLAACAPDGIAGTLRLGLPAGWRAEPDAVPVRFTAPGETQVMELTVHPPAGIAAGDFPVRAVFAAEDGRSYTRGFQLVDYPHIRPRPLYREAAATVRAFDVRVPSGLRVGYIAGPGDGVPEALAQLGIAVDLLDGAALSGAGAPAQGTAGPNRPSASATGLARYDVIIVGIRAYELRPDLRANHARLLDYVRGGGTLIVQYNQYEWSEGGYAPYPLSIGRPHDRVTDEAAPVTLLDPSHPILSYPNRITDADFEGWVQERGLYFPRTWDERYTPLLEMADPGEEPKRGALLVANVGRGTYVYTGLALFRQLPAGVPGAYRLLANLIALGERKTQ